MSDAAAGEDEPAEGWPEIEPVALMAHDVRAAISDVIGGLRLLPRDALEEEARDQLDRVQAASELLARLVEELLEDRLGRGTAPAETVTDLRRLLSDELRRWRGAAAPMGLAVVLEADDDLPHLMRVQSLPLRRILSNAIGNALRYAESRVVLSARRVETDIEIAVRDDGPGFAPDLLGRLFEASRRGDDSTGTGMGLHIASAHAKWIGGRLEAGNHDDGAEVILYLPTELEVAPEPDDRAEIDLSGWRVLVADDSETVQALLAGMLGQLGAECERAGDGVAALNWLARERFDLAMVDMEMPLLGGREVIRAERLRQARGVAPPTPMIALTAHVSAAMHDALTEEGADGVLTKPLPDTRTFGRALAGLIDFGGGRPNWEPEAAPALSAAMLSALMMAAGAEHSEEMLDRMRDDLASVDTALEAALDEPDLKQVGFQTHVLLSLAGAVGALPTQTLSRRLNDLARNGDSEAVRVTGRVCLARLRELRAELDRAG